MAQKRIFAVRDKQTKKVTRLFKAETRTQVSRHLASSIEINGIDALELADLFSTGEVLKIEEVSVDVAEGTDTTSDAAATSDVDAADAVDTN